MITTIEASLDQLPQALRIGVAQISPVWLNREATVTKVTQTIVQAAQSQCELVVFGESLVPGYPFWLSETNGATFNDPAQKAAYAQYLDQAVTIEAGHLAPICSAAKTHEIAVYLGIAERAPDRSGHSIYCTLVYIDAQGTIQSTHRKLQPTYEERLVWAPGDGHGLRTHALGAFQLGGLNCWENWMPLARASLYAQGVDLFVSVWPGGLHNTADNSRFVALESRSYVIAASGLLHTSDIPTDAPFSGSLDKGSLDNGYLANGGSTIVGPDGVPIIEPVTEQEALLIADLDPAVVRGERQNFDPAGHYSRPDVTELRLDRTRQSTLKISKPQAHV